MALAVAIFAGGAGWVLRAPFVAKPVANAPEIDLERDLPAFRDEPMALTASAATSHVAAGASSVSAGKAIPDEDCGETDSAQFVETQVILAGTPVSTMTQVKAASTRHVTAQSTVDAALRASSDPFDRMVADAANVGDMRTPSGVAEAVAQQATSTTDGRAYALAYGVCQYHREDAPSCNALTARRWTEVDGGNGVPWLEMLRSANERGDVAGQQEALSGLASSSRFDVRANAATAAVLRRMPQQERDFGAVNEMAMHVLGVGQVTPVRTLLEVCRNEAGGNAAAARQCQQISDVMYEHSDGLLMFSVSGNLQLQLSGDASRRDRVKAERQRLSAATVAEDDSSMCKVVHRMSKFMLRSGEIGELSAMRERVRSPQAAATP